MNGFATLCFLAALQQAQDVPATTRPVPAKPMSVPRTVVVHRGDKKISVDGSLRDWPSVPVLSLADTRQLSGTAMGAWRGPSDCAATAFLAWDEEDLFFAAKVIDDRHRKLPKNAPRLTEIPPADGLVISFDPNRDTRSIGMDKGRTEDREFWLAEVEGQGRKLVRWDRYRGTAGFAEGAAMAVKRDEERHMTTYEARIPWKSILPTDRQPKLRMVMDLGIVVNDYDELTDPMPQTRIGWTFGTGPRVDPGLLGSLMLVRTINASISDLPDFPPHPELNGDPVPGEGHWIQFHEQLRKHPPSPTLSGGGHPSEAGGIKRLELLEDLERHLAQFPRVDYLEYVQRTDRRMRREVAGVIRSGLPFYWHHALTDLGRRASLEAPDKGFRIFRLPEGGWLIRSRTANFAIDPSGYNLERHVWGALDFVLLTSPLDITKRNDQILLRLWSAKRPFYTHIKFHLPALTADKMPLVKIGETYTLSDMKIKVLGRIDEKGWVTTTVGYRVEWPDGTVLMHSGQALQEAELPTDEKVDLLILSARHPRARVVGQRVRAKWTLMEDALQCSARPGADGRVRLSRVFDLQNGLRPFTSLLLAPGESWNIFR